MEKEMGIEAEAGTCCAAEVRGAARPEAAMSCCDGDTGDARAVVHHPVSASRAGAAAGSETSALGERKYGRVPSTLEMAVALDDVALPGAEEAYYDLGTHSWPVSTDSAEAQRWFDRGLMWMYAFNHEEAGLCFSRAAKADPGCAMAHWGVAYVLGPNYNKPWGKFDRVDLASSLEAAVQATARAQAVAGAATPLEQALVMALSARYPSTEVPDDFTQWNIDYTAAMREVYEEFGESAEVATLFVDAAININPRQFWEDPATQPAGSVEGIELQRVLERALGTSGGFMHPGTLHLYTHVLERSPYPERGLAVADRLRGLVPAAGHLHHMPSHLDTLAGDYASVVASNSAAVEADREYVRREGGMSFYTLYRLHNLHFKIYGSMMSAREGLALEAADEMIAALPAELLSVPTPPMADWAEGSVSMRIHVLIRFGRWREILGTELPEDRELFCVTTAMTLYAQTLAHAALGEIAEAEARRMEFLAAAETVPPSRDVFDTLCVDQLEVAKAMVEGELEYRKGNLETAFVELRRAVELNDALPVGEPWGQMVPPRHALGALLLEQRRYAEAELVYRTDLGLNDLVSRTCQRPNNVWSLHGLHECLLALGKADEAEVVGKQLTLARARADVPVVASCLCRRSVVSD